MKRALRLLMLLLIRIYGALRFGLIRLRKHSTALEKRQGLRILLIRPDHLGDLILVTPVLQALRDRMPDAHITFMVGPWSREVVERHPAVNEVISCSFPGFQRALDKKTDPFGPYKLLFRTARELRQKDYDLAINLRPDFWWGAALLYLAGIRQRVGYAIEPGAGFLTHALPFPVREHATVSNLRLVSQAIEVSGRAPLKEPFTPTRYPLVFKPDLAEQAWVKERLVEAHLALDQPVVVIHAGTGGAVKLWRTESWAFIGDTIVGSHLFSQTPQIILTGSPKERPMLEEIAGAMTIPPLLITNATVGQLAALLQYARVVLGVDNGPLHLATAQDTPSLRLFGPTDTHIFGPWGIPERHVVIMSQKRCPSCPVIPCGRLDFAPEELIDHPCVRVISEKEVMQVLTNLVHQQVLYSS